MDLISSRCSDLYFPKLEWQWLRPAARFEQTPDAFVWAARVQGKLWAWHPSGAELKDAAPESAIQVLVLKTDGSELEGHGLFLKTSFAMQPAQDVEWAAALGVLKDRLNHDIGEQGLPRFWAEALQACKLEAHLGVLAQRARYGFLNAAERELIFEKRWDLSTLELVETFEPEVRTALVAALKKWNLTANQAKEATNHVLILAKKISVKAAINVLSSDYKSGEELRMALLRTAQPELASMAQKRLEMLRGLQLPGRTAVFGDPSFEKDILKITHNPKNIGDVENFKDWISNADVREKIRALLEIYQ